MSAPSIPIGARVHVSDRYYTGLAIVLEYDANVPDPHHTPDDWGGPYYCHLYELCDHEMCADDDDYFDEECRRLVLDRTGGQP
jgi:hypothetical protein